MTAVCNTLSLLSSPYTIVGILNVTPDSYFDGGKYTAVDAALKRAETLLQEGADIIDIGGESTGPGSKDISLEEELDRTITIIQSLHRTFPEAKLSIDTYTSAVALQAIEAGASMVNDVTAGRGDHRMFQALSDTDASLVLMFAKDDTARTTVQDTQYDDVTETVSAFLKERIECAVASGIARERIIIDPGMGHFVSADPQYSYELIAHLTTFTALAPVYVSPSRKSFLAGENALPPEERLPATIVASALCVHHGATYIRTHDVAAVKQGCDTMLAIGS